MSADRILQIAPAWVHFWMRLSYWGQKQPDLIRCNNSFISTDLNLLTGQCKQNYHLTLTNQMSDGPVEKKESFISLGLVVAAR